MARQGVERRALGAAGAVGVGVHRRGFYQNGAPAQSPFRRVAPSRTEDAIASQRHPGGNARAARGGILAKAGSGAQTTERAHDDDVRPPVGEWRSREHHLTPFPISTLPFSAMFYFRFWLYFTSGFGLIPLPKSAFFGLARQELNSGEDRGRRPQSGPCGAKRSSPRISARSDCVRNRAGRRKGAPPCVLPHGAHCSARRNLVDFAAKAAPAEPSAARRPGRAPQSIEGDRMNIARQTEIAD